MKLPFPQCADRWLLEDAPVNSVVVSSRARLARNLPNVPFAPRAGNDKLAGIAATIAEAFETSPLLAEFNQYEMAGLTPAQRQFLKESHLISGEFEKGGVGRLVYLNPEMNLSLMVNEEDHLRMASMLSGLRLGEAYARLIRVEEEVGRRLELAYSEELGFLTACPTNTGTALRLSVMLHLPGLAIVEKVEAALAQLSNLGLVVRGAYGEHTENTGDLFQVSNDVTLGKSEEEILELLSQCVGQIVETELNVRRTLMSDTRDKVEDAIYRAMGVLSMARRLDSKETAGLLSRTRLGIGLTPEIPWTDAQLSWLLVEIQPSHIEARQPARQGGAEDAGVAEPSKRGQSLRDPGARDLARAELVRAFIQGKLKPPVFNN